MTYSDLDADHARAELYEIMRAAQSFEEKANRALELGEAYLGVENAHLTRIDKRIDFWETLASTDPPDGDFSPGEVLDLQTTYCRRVVENGSTIALSDAPEQGWDDDPAFEEHGLHCYHGTPLTVDGDIYGTLCFVSEAPREAPFTESETLFAELIARMLETELRTARQTAELNLQSNLISVLSRVLRHNLRNDLNVIRGHLTKLSEQSDGGLIENEAAVEKIDKLVDLANTAREIESIASSELDRQPVELGDLARHLVTRIQSMHPDAALSLEIPSEIYIEALPTLGTALEEIIENAAKHSGESPMVTVSVEPAADAVEITVSDNGPGLPEQEQEVLRNGVEKPLIHGSGLGLWLSYWIVSNHEGSITTDVGDDGTAVTVTIPRTSSYTEFGDSQSLLHSFHREQDRFEAVFEQSFDAIVIFDDDGRYTDVNQSAAELFGLSQAELRGRPLDEFVADEIDLDESWAAFKDAKRERDTYTLQRADGSKRTVEYSAVANIVPGQHLAILRDITERRRRERRYEALSRGLPDLCFIFDGDGVYRDVLTNPQNENNLIGDPDELVGQRVTDILPPAKGQLITEYIEKTLEAGEPHTFHFELMVPCGQRVFEGRTAVLPEEEEGQRLVSIVVRDITDLPSGKEAVEAV